MNVSEQDKPLLIALLAILAVALLCWLAPLSSPQNNQQNTSYSIIKQQDCPSKISSTRIERFGGAQSAKQQQNCKSQPPHGVLFWLDDSNHILLLATIALAIFAFLQAETTRRSFKRQLRAYIQVEQGSLQDMAQINAHNIFLGGWAGSIITIKNTGQTPARNVIHFCAIKVVKFGNESELKLPTLKEIRGGGVSTLGQNIPTTASRWLPQQMSQEDLNLILTLRGAMFVYGCIFYEDIYKRRRKTIYRFQWTGGWPPPPNVILGFSPDGNDYD